MMFYTIKWTNKENKESTGYIIQDFSIRLFLTEGDAQSYLNMHYVLSNDKHKQDCDYSIVKIKLEEV
jgi:hypothetical protein